MEYKEMDLIVPQDYADLASLILCECGSQGTVLHDDENRGDDVRITAYFSASDTGAEQQIRDKLRELQSRDSRLGHWHLSSKDANDKDWLYTWQDYFHAQKVSPHFWVQPAWETMTPPAGDAVITIDPGVAFGSGLHATTGMCIAYLEEVVKPDSLVYDIGTGTGILAIAAAKLGAAHVTAVDLDAQAVNQAVVNVDLNNVENVVEVLNSDLLDAISEDGPAADVIVANLVTNAVLALLPSMQRYCKAGTEIIVSGIIDDRIGEIRQAAAKEGYTWVADTLRDGWYAVRLRRD